MFSRPVFLVSAWIKWLLNKEIEDIVMDKQRIYVVSVYNIYVILQECRI